MPATCLALSSEGRFSWQVLALALKAALASEPKQALALQPVPQLPQLAQALALQQLTLAQAEAQAEAHQNPWAHQHLLPRHLQGSQTPRPC